MEQKNKLQDTLFLFKVYYCFISINTTTRLQNSSLYYIIVCLERTQVPHFLMLTWPSLDHLSCKIIKQYKVNEQSNFETGQTKNENKFTFHEQWPYLYLTT